MVMLLSYIQACVTCIYILTHISLYPHEIAINGDIKKLGTMSKSEKGDS